MFRQVSRLSSKNNRASRRDYRHRHHIVIIGLSSLLLLFNNAYPTLSDTAHPSALIGTVNGLGVLPIFSKENFGMLTSYTVTRIPGTGKLDDHYTPQESSHSAYYYVKKHAHSLGIDPDMFDQSDLCMYAHRAKAWTLFQNCITTTLAACIAHSQFFMFALFVSRFILANFLRKNSGPSAGITLATALVSTLTQRPVDSNYAMTGEIDLDGNITAVGGIKEKITAAKEAGITDVIIPADNLADIQGYPELQEDIQIIPVSRAEEVFKLVLLPHIPSPQGK